MLKFNIFEFEDKFSTKTCYWKWSLHNHSMHRSFADAICYYNLLHRVTVSQKAPTVVLLRVCTMSQKTVPTYFGLCDCQI